MRKKNVALGIGGLIGGAIAWKLASRPQSVHFEEYADLIPNSKYSKFVDIDGMEVHYQEFGIPSNPTLFLIHGYTSSTYSWKVVAPEFARKGYHVIAVDLIGYGYSAKPKWFDYKIASQARMIVRFMDRIGIGKASIVGSSFGGGVASWLTLDNPARIEKLVLVSTVINDDPKDYPILKLVSLPGVGEVLTPFLADSKAFLKVRMRGTIDPENHHLITQERIDSVIRPLRSAEAHHSLLATSRNWDANRIEEDAHLIDQPTLIVWGDGDTVVPLSNADKLYDKVLNSRLVILRDCGHLPHEEKPIVFVDLIDNFLSNRSGRIEKGNSKEIELRQIEP